MLRENIIVIDCSFYPLFVHAIRFSQWSEPDEDALVKFMCEGKNFSEDRIRTGTKRLAKARGGQTQMRMDSFFKVMELKALSKAVLVPVMGRLRLKWLF